MNKIVDISKVEFKRVEKDRLIKIVNGKKKCSKCKQWKLINCFGKYSRNVHGLYSHCIECTKAYSFKETRRVKLICMIGYGGKCICCGESIIEMLTIEHIRHKGYYLVEGTGTAMMKELIRRDFPKGHTILCSGCNSFTKNGRPCIHSKEWLEYFNKNIKPYKYARQKELDELEHKWAVMNGKTPAIKRIK